MTITTEIKNNIVVPLSIQRRAGIRRGDKLEFNVSGKTITIKPELSEVDDEYTPKQRKMIDARIKKSLEDIKKGKFYGPFNSTKEMENDFYKRYAKFKKTKK